MTGRPVTGRRGAAIVETVVALPLLLMVLFGGLEFAWAFTKKVEVTNAARVGARAASMAGSDSSQVYSAVEDQMTAAGFPPGAWNVQIDPADPAGVVAGTPLTITVQADYQSVSLGALAAWAPVPQSISSRAVMRKEGGR